MLLNICPGKSETILFMSALKLLFFFEGVKRVGGGRVTFTRRISLHLLSENKYSFGSVGLLSRTRMEQNAQFIWLGHSDCKIGSLC